MKIVPVVARLVHGLSFIIQEQNSSSSYPLHSVICSIEKNRNMTKIAVAKGDGIGPEIMSAVLSVFDAAKVPMEYEFRDLGHWVLTKGYSNGMTPVAQQTTRCPALLF